MADRAEVEDALVRLGASALYPDGTAAAASVTGAVYRVYRGWPANAALEADLAAGICHVSIAGQAGGGPVPDQFPADWEPTVLPAPTLTVQTTGAAITFGGTASTGQLAGILVNDTGFSYRTRMGDTPPLVAASLAALINSVMGASVSGATVTVPGSTRLIGRVVADQTALLPMRRQRDTFVLTCWCADPATRDATARAIDAVLAQTPFLALPDGSAGRLLYDRSVATDDLSTLPLYRRELHYHVAYTTTLVQMQPSMLFGIADTATVSGTPVLHLS